MNAFKSRVKLFQGRSLRRQKDLSSEHDHILLAFQEFVQEAWAHSERQRHGEDIAESSLGSIVCLECHYVLFVSYREINMDKKHSIMLW